MHIYIPNLIFSSGSLISCICLRKIITKKFHFSNSSKYTVILLFKRIIHSLIILMQELICSIILYNSDIIWKKRDMRGGRERNQCERTNTYSFFHHETNIIPLYFIVNFSSLTFKLVIERGTWDNIPSMWDIFLKVVSKMKFLFLFGFVQHNNKYVRNILFY